jgi:hypothetical protein
VPHRLAPSVVRSAQHLLERAEQMRSVLDQAATVAADAPGDQAALAPVKEAFSRVLDGYRSRIDESEELARASIGYAKEYAATGGGVLAGGGGADPKWTTDKKNSAVLDITGAGVIKSDTKLTLQVAGTDITIEDGSITLHGAQIYAGNGEIQLNGKTIKLTAGTVTISDGTVSIGGGDTSVSSDNLLALTGTPITLND